MFAYLCVLIFKIYFSMCSLIYVYLFLKSTLAYVRVFMCIYVYIYIWKICLKYVTGFWMYIFECTFLNSFLKSTLESVHAFM